MKWNEIRKDIINRCQLVVAPDTTKQIRHIAKQSKNDIMQLSLEEVFLLAESFLKMKNQYYIIIAYQILDYKHEDFTIETYDIFEKFVLNYVSDWWDCDDFMTHAFTKLLLKFPNILQKIDSLTTHERFAVRRCAPVLLVIPARKGLLDINEIFRICDLVFYDKHYLVQKGYGWLLKEASKKYQSDVVKYLEKNIDIMPRTAFRYALEKLPENERKRLMHKLT